MGALQVVFSVHCHLMCCTPVIALEIDLGCTLTRSLNLVGNDSWDVKLRKSDGHLLRLLGVAPSE